MAIRVGDVGRAVTELAPGGAVLATNHVPEVQEADWHGALRRCAEKAGRPLRALERVPVDTDFPSFDGQPPLKVALATTADDGGG